MSFSEKLREDALVKSHRKCSVCHEFAGRSTNVHHIIQEADGGTNGIENAIVLCLRCHAEAGHYNPRPPLGAKYSPDELRRHRDQWWDLCQKAPWELMARAESMICRGECDEAMEVLNDIMAKFPESHEAHTIQGLLRITRQKGSTSYKGSVGSCAESDARSIKTMLDAMAVTSGDYGSTTPVKREALDRIFGSATFPAADITLDKLLAAALQLEASRQKALGNK